MHRAEGASARVYGAAMGASDRGVVPRFARGAAVVLFAVVAGCGERGSSGSPVTTVPDDVAVTTRPSTPPPDSTAAPEASSPAEDLAGAALIDVDPRDGTPRWMAGDAELVSMRAVLPLADVVVGFGDDCRGDNVETAWDRATGSELWRTDPWSATIPGVPNNQYMRSVQLGEIDGTVAVPRPDSVLGVEPSGGTIRWTFTPDSGSVVGVSPAAEVFVVGTIDDLGGVTYQGLDPTTGASRWSTTLDQGRFDGAFAAGDHIVVVPGYDAAGAVMLALDADDGTTRWEVPASAGSDRGLPEIAAGDVVVATSEVGAVIGLDPDSGAQRWQLADGYWLAGQSSSSQENGAILRARDVHVLSSEGVSLLDKERGDIVWTTTWDEQRAVFSGGFIATTTEGDALFWRSPVTEEVSAGAELALVGRGKETVWDTTVVDLPSQLAEVIADRSDVYLLTGCGGE